MLKCLLKCMGFEAKEPTTTFLEPRPALSDVERDYPPIKNHVVFLTDDYNDWEREEAYFPNYCAVV